MKLSIHADTYKGSNPIFMVANSWFISIICHWNLSLDMKIKSFIIFTCLLFLYSNWSDFHTSRHNIQCRIYYTYLQVILIEFLNSLVIVNMHETIQIVDERKKKNEWMTWNEMNVHRERSINIDTSTALFSVYIII